MTEAAEFTPRSWRTRGRMPETKRSRLAVRAADLAFGDAASAAAWAPQLLDIGFGYGESLLALAAAFPDLRLLGVDVHAPGQLRAMDRLAEASAANVRVLPEDVTALLPLLAPGTLTLIQALHPDPWPKRRHATRRLLSAPVLARCVELLAPGGVLHMVVDDDSYAAGLHAALSGLPMTRTEHPPPPETRYGRRAVAAGRIAHRIAYAKAT
ncbi:MAG TPA: methyltransferase domain-containing protein [Sporichthyaceae bacterium]|jgi:tRNA (guanine-N7-)-methyltransferase